MWRVNSAPMSRIGVEAVWRVVGVSFFFRYVQVGRPQRTCGKCWRMQNCSVTSALRGFGEPHKLIVNHSHSWLPPRGGPERALLCPPSWPIVTPCMTLAMVVCPACCVMLAAFARVTGA